MNPIKTKRGNRKSRLETTWSQGETSPRSTRKPRPESKQKNLLAASFLIGWCPVVPVTTSREL